MKEEFLREALRLARQAAEAGEVPVGCVVVKEKRIVGRGRNRTRELGDPTAHAEIVALREAAKNLGEKELRGAEVFVTLEPCPMCAGALSLVGVRKIYFGAPNPKHGAVITRFFIPEAYGVGWELLRCDECGELLSSFFKELREDKL